MIQESQYEVFLRSFDKDEITGCWNWNRKKRYFGYGTISEDNKQYLAHRYSYFKLIGDIPEGMCVCHHCDNPGCVNPEHLWLGTQQDNLNDMFRKKRNKAPVGENNANSKIKEKDVAEIKKLLKTAFTVSEIAIILKISKHIIVGIKNNRTWQHLNKRSINE